MSTLRTGRKCVVVENDSHFFDLALKTMLELRRELYGSDIGGRRLQKCIIGEEELMRLYGTTSRKQGKEMDLDSVDFEDFDTGKEEASESSTVALQEFDTSIDMDVGSSQSVPQPSPSTPASMRKSSISTAPFTCTGIASRFNASAKCSNAEKRDANTLHTFQALVDKRDSKIINLVSEDGVAVGSGFFGDYFLS